MRLVPALLLPLAAACAAKGAPAPATPPAATTTATVAAVDEEAYGPRELARDALALEGFVTTDLGRAFVAAAPSLPSIQPRTVWHTADKAQWYRASDVASAPDRSALVEEKIDESYYYAGRWGTPLAYVRAIEVLGKNGVGTLAGQHVLDIGAGGIASSRLLAAMGATVVAYDVDASLPVIYGEPGDQGPVAAGSARLFIAATPFTPRAAEAPFDLIISKNVLKRGYIHPERAADPKRLIQLGVDDVTYLEGLRDLLKPRGLMLIYNITPPEAPLDQPYIPWADGRSPWTIGEWDAAGFDVIAFDIVDDAAIRAMGRALSWGAEDETLFGRYTLLRRR